MIISKNTTEETTHYDILLVNEDASYEELRASYRSALLNSHPDKSSYTSDLHATKDKFLNVQKAWEVLSDSNSRAIYDIEIRSKRRREMFAEENVELEDMTVEEEDGSVFVLSYECRCGDYFSVDSSDLGQMGYTILRDGGGDGKIFIRTREDDLPVVVSIVLPCGSCSLKVCLLINSNNNKEGNN